MAVKHFLGMIKSLRQDEEVVLHANILDTSPQEEQEVEIFLLREFQNEAKGYPYHAPAFKAEAAIWSAQTVYLAAQLILYRKDEQTELHKLFPYYNEEIDAAAVLSADLCLRFIPDMLHQLQLIDVEDPLIPILERMLSFWSYSGVGYFEKIDQMDFTAFLTNKCLKQLFIDRIIQRKSKQYLVNKNIYQHIAGNLGLYQDEFWPGFTSISL